MRSADKDDLKEGAGAEYVLKSNVVLVYCTERYFKSRPCAREIIYAVLLKKPLVAVLEPDPARGGLKRCAIEELLTKQRFTPHGKDDAPADHSWVAKWKLEGEIVKWGFTKMPTSAEIAEALFQDEAIEWNRLTAFQAVSARRTAERALPEKERNHVYVESEPGTQEIAPPPLTHGRKFHLYCSPHNAGAEKIGTDLSQLLEQLSPDKSRRDANKPLLKMTTSLEALDRCEHMLLYLTTKTWTNGKHSTELARELGKARRNGVHLLLVHELPSHVLDDDVGTDRGACDFYDMWNEGWTPPYLLATNLYNQIALPLKPNEFHRAALAVVLGKLSEGGGERVKLSEEEIKLSEEAEEKGLREHVPAQLKSRADNEPAGRPSNIRKTKAGGTNEEQLAAPTMCLTTVSTARASQRPLGPALSRHAELVSSILADTRAFTELCHLVQDMSASEGAERAISSAWEGGAGDISVAGGNTRLLERFGGSGPRWGGDQSVGSERRSHCGSAGDEGGEDGITGESGGFTAREAPPRSRYQQPGPGGKHDPSRLAAAKTLRAQMRIMEDLPAAALPPPREPGYNSHRPGRQQRLEEIRKRREERKQAVQASVPLEQPKPQRRPSVSRVMLQPLYDSAAWLRRSRASKDFETESPTGHDARGPDSLVRTPDKLEAGLDVQLPDQPLARRQGGTPHVGQLSGEADVALEVVGADPNSTDEPPVYMALAARRATRPAAGATIAVFAPPEDVRRRSTLRL